LIVFQQILPGFGRYGKRIRSNSIVTVRFVSESLIGMKNKVRKLLTVKSTNFFALQNFQNNKCFDLIYKSKLKV
jgi:hypothetical protein